MATADHLKALIRSHAEGDDERFYAVAIQVAAQAARRGHTRFARDLKDIVDRARQGSKNPQSSQKTRPVPAVRLNGELSGLLAAEFPKIRLSDMQMEDNIRSRLRRILLEQRQRRTILSSGMRPLQKILLLGPRGTGKTMTARALAGELNVSLLTVRLDGLIARYLEETAAKLRLIFEAVRETRAVYLFDEFDVLGAERAARNEVGETRRVLSSFLQFLEQEDSDSIIIAATSRPEMLDRALFRRFDCVIEYSLPSDDVVEKMLRSRTALFDTSGVDWSRTVEAARGLAHSDLARACEHAAKNVLLQERAGISTDDLVADIEERHRPYSRFSSSVQQLNG